MDGSLIGLLGRLMISLAVVLALIVVTGRVLRRSTAAGGRTPSATPTVEVLSRRPLGRSASIAVVRVGDRALVLGITESSVRLLADAGAELLPEPALAPASAAAPVPPAFTAALAANSSSLLNSLRERTVRR